MSDDRTELDDPTPQTISPETPVTLEETTRAEPSTEHPAEQAHEGAPGQLERPNADAPEAILDFGPYEPVPGLPLQDQPTWQQKFIAALRISPVVGTAARAAGKGRTTVYDWRGRDAIFAAAWTSALEDGADRIEQAIIERAVTGTEEVYETFHSDGTLKTRRVRRVFNDRGAEFMLKAIRPQKYRERYEVHNIDDSTIDADIMALDAEMRELAKAAGDPAVPKE